MFLSPGSCLVIKWHTDEPLFVHFDFLRGFRVPWLPGLGQGSHLFAGPLP